MFFRNSSNKTKNLNHQRILCVRGIDEIDLNGLEIFRMFVLNNISSVYFDPVRDHNFGVIHNDPTENHL